MRINTHIKITTLTILVSTFLFACGGGGGNLIAEGGITGTGITMGRITNFGSIFVNGIRFDVDNATFLRDDMSSTGQNEFSVGEYVVINGSIDATGTSGVASSVTFNDILEGAVTAASTDNTTIEILGQSVKRDQLTVLHGFATLNDLIAGNIVEVSGIKDASGVITATSIKLKQTSFIAGVSENELKGTITNLDPNNMTFTINSITVEFAGASLEGFGGQSLQNGQFVEAKSDLMIMSNTLIASKVELEDEFQDLGVNTEAEIEGKVTRFSSTTDFDVNGLTVTTNASTDFENGTAADISLNTFMEVEGQVDASGILVAEEISFEETESAIELKGNLESIDISANEIVISNQVIVIDASTIMIDESSQNISPLTINDLAVGEEIEIKGIALANGKILATKLEREEDD